MKYFNNSQLIAFTSDAGIDFTPEDFNAPLSLAQQAYLKQATAVNIPQVFWCKQIHGDDIVHAVQLGGHVPNACPDADAFVTNERGLPIAIRTADCVPVFIFDPVQKAIGLAHAGWKGTVKQIAAKTIKSMQEKFNSRCADLEVSIGPCIRPCCYQVGAEFKGYFPLDIIERDGHLYVDVAASNRRQLLEAGVLDEHITDVGTCTCCDNNYFSFRRDANRSGRMISLMMLI